jgi:hypothetical protein
VDIDQFERAAAEVADDAVGPIKTRNDTERCQLGLALAGDDVDLGAADQLSRGDKVLAVPRIAASGGRQHPQPLHLHGVAERTEPLKRYERLLHRVRGQQTLGLHLAAEAGECFLVEQGRRASGYALIDHEPHRVGADVDHRDRRPVIEPALRHGGGGGQLLKHERPAGRGCGATIL